MYASILLREIQKGNIDNEDLPVLISENTDIGLLLEELLSNKKYQSDSIIETVFFILAYKNPKKAKELLDKYAERIIHVFDYLTYVMSFPKHSYRNVGLNIINDYVDNVLVKKMEALTKKYKIILTTRINKIYAKKILKSVRYIDGLSYKNYNNFKKSLIFVANADYYIGYFEPIFKFSSNTYSFKAYVEKNKKISIGDFIPEKVKEIEEIEKDILSLSLPKFHAKMIDPYTLDIIKFIKEAVI